MTIGSLAARVHDSHMDDITLTTTLTQTASSKEISLYLFCVLYIYIKYLIENENLLQNKPTKTIVKIILKHVY